MDKEEKKERLMSALAQHITDTWEENKSHKESSGIDQKLIDSLRAFKGEYSPDKLAKIRMLKSSEIFIPVINMKCRAAYAMLKEPIFQPGEIPWTLNPTPIPTLPQEIQGAIKSKVDSLFQTMLEAQNSLSETGQIIPMSAMGDRLSEYQDELKEVYKKMVEKAAKEAVEGAKLRIEDEFIEGGFYNALKECIHDFCIFPTAILKGPIIRKEKRYKRNSTNRAEKEERLISTYQRVSPFDMYPSPHSSNIQDGNCIERVRISYKDLYNLIGVDGFQEDEIREVINKKDTGGLSDWTSVTEQEREDLENKDFGKDIKSDIIALEYHGSVKGELLKEWGVSEKQGVIDEDEYYDICAWLIDTNIIKVYLNPDPFGKKPYSTASWIEMPGSFWGMSIPDVLMKLAEGLNSIARHMITNVALSSGPMIERNIDRLPGGASTSKDIRPYMVWDSNDQMMTGAPAFKFYQTSITSDKLAFAFDLLLKLADEYSGIPAYSHGDISVGGSGRTASGLSMLMSNSARGIKVAIENVDRGLIEPTVERQYYYDIENGMLPEDIPDLRIQAKGSLALAEKESQTVRTTELLRVIATPAVMQSFGPQVTSIIKELVQKIAKSEGIDLEEALSEIPDTMSMGMPPEMGGTMGQPNPQMMNNPNMPGGFINENGR